MTETLPGAITWMNPGNITWVKETRYKRPCILWFHLNEISVSLKKTHRWPGGTWKDARQPQLWERCKLKVQWGTTTLVRMAIVKKSKNNKCQEGRGERESSYTVGAATMENSREFLLLLFFFLFCLWTTEIYFSQFWRLEIQYQGNSMARLGPFLSCRLLSYRKSPAYEQVPFRECACKPSLFRSPTKLALVFSVFKVHVFCAFSYVDFIPQ